MYMYMYMYTYIYIHIFVLFLYFIFRLPFICTDKFLLAFQHVVCMSSPSLSCHPRS